MSLNDEERKIVIQLEIEKAKSIFNQINELAYLGYWDNIANRLYYALFHAVSALLIYDKHSVGTHKGAVALFGQHYVKTGVFSLSDGRLYSQLQTMREKSDYNCTYEMTEEEVAPKISPAKLLIERIENFISQ